MKPYTTLIKLTKEDLDRKRRELNIVLDKKDELLAKKQQLQESLLQEQEFVNKSSGQNPTGAYGYTSFAAKIGMQQENIDRTVAMLDEEIEKMSKTVAESFAELKKYEIIMEKKNQEILAESARLERIEMDELGMMRFNKKSE